MSDEEKSRHKAATNRYRKEHPEIYRKAALVAYYKDKKAASAKAKVWRLNNREYITNKQREHKRQRKLDAIAFMGGACADCKTEFQPYIFEFHHLDPRTKDKDPSKLLSLSWERIVLELEKCVLLCANCHRTRHHKEDYN